MDRAEELERLKAKRDARKGQRGYADNVKAIEKRIAELGSTEN